MVAMYQEDATMQALASRFNCADMTIRNILIRNNVELRQRKLIKNMVCIHPGCNFHRKTRKHCPGHWTQFQRTGRTWDINSVAKRKSLDEEIASCFRDSIKQVFERIEERANAQEA